MTLRRGPLPQTATPVPYALAMVVSERRFVVCHIQGRGWCVPSGRIEPGETAEQAARREAREEAGAELGHCVNYAYYEVNRTGELSYVPLFVAPLVSLGRLPECESSSVRLATLEELPDLYYFWNDTLAEAFGSALETPNRATNVPNLEQG